jgi:hypothetical protein
MSGLRQKRGTQPRQPKEKVLLFAPLNFGIVPAEANLRFAEGNQ